MKYILIEIIIIERIICQTELRSHTEGLSIRGTIIAGNLQFKLLKTLILSKCLPLLSSIISVSCSSMKEFGFSKIVNIIWPPTFFVYLVSFFHWFAKIWLLMLIVDYSSGTRGQSVSFNLFTMWPIFIFFWVFPWLLLF